MVSFWYHLLLGLVLLGGTTTLQGVAALNKSCTDLTNLDSLPQDQFIDRITDSCYYDKYERPDMNITTLKITVEPSIYHLEASQSQFTVYMTIKYTYVDQRLTYSEYSQRKVMGDESLKAKIWTPNIYIIDHINSTVTSSKEQDVLISIKPTGEVLYSYKMVVTFFCSLKLEKFPFDWQECTLHFSDWTYNKDNILLDPAFEGAILAHFSDFVIDNITVTQSENSGPHNENPSSSDDHYSVMSITLSFHRDVGYYLLDFFIPSYLLVFTAWVTFWLQADAGPPRATLGASTVIAFVTLHLGVAKDIPKVSYVKASDIWFLGISCFIFFSLAEFAFVNVIWRRKKTVELRKEKPKYIFKSAVMPSVARKDLRKYESTQSLWTPSADNMRSLSVASLPQDQQYNGIYKNGEVAQNGTRSHSTITIPEDSSQQHNWKTMTPQEVAIWVDRRARLLFPLIFLIFNILYWTFVYVL